MTESQQNDHAHFREHIATALAGGLDDAQRLRFEAHARECELCAAEFRASEQLEHHMSALFAHPAPGLEDRIINSLRSAPRRLRLHVHPAIRRAVTGVAAAILIAGIGYHVDRQLTPPVEQARNEHWFAQTPGAEFAVSGDTNPATSRYDNGHVYWDSNSPAAADRFARPAIAGSNTYKGATSAGQPSFNLQQQPAAAAPPAARFKNNNASDWSMLHQDIKELPQLQEERSRSGGIGGAEGRSAGYFKIDQLGDEVRKHNMDVPNVELSSRLGRVARQPDAGTTVTSSAEPAQEGAPVADDGAAPAQQAVVGKPIRAVGQEIIESRKIIRTGEMEFEVDRYDAAFAQVSKLTAEAGGYVGTTDSEKLPNGKVKGAITLRVPPDRLDTLVLQLRGIGDLRAQKLDANDVTRQYTDLESELRAARAMEERLLAIIKEGKGEIKDLLAAEKELGNWRTKIEKIVGQVKYFDNQVALSTLIVSLYERDIKTPAMAHETETIDAGLESADVEKARADALKAIEDAKGRVIQSDLKRFDAGQFGATIVAEVPPENAGPLLDRLKQIGKIARLDIQRKQTASSSADSNAPVRVEKKPSRLNLSLYNLANVAPRISSTLTLAANDVEAAYAAIIERINKSAGRVVNSNLAKHKPEQTTGTINFEVPAAAADAMLNELRALGDVMNLTVTENPDAQNATAAKRGFALTLVSTASIPPRESTALTVETRDVETAIADLQLAVSQAGGRIVESNLTKNTDGATTGKLAFEVPLEKSATLIDQFKKHGVIRAVQRSQNLEVPVSNLARARIDLQLATPDTLVDARSGPLARIRAGLSTSLAGLLWSLELLVIGICFVLPFALVLYAAWKLLRRRHVPA